jgi:PHP family Zn ribbon phosphoesterase
MSKVNRWHGLGVVGRRRNGEYSKRHVHDKSLNGTDAPFESDREAAASRSGLDEDDGTLFLGRCFDCNRTVSRSAMTCSQCGCQLKEGFVSNVATGVINSFFLALVLAIIIVVFTDWI